MPQSSKLAAIKEMIESAESSLRLAKQLLTDSGVSSSKSDYTKLAKDIVTSPTEEDGDQIVEGVFNGQTMNDPKGKDYPVPANYASKSKLVPGDVLKLTIKEDGSFRYKQISPVERKRIIGILTYEDGKYKVIAKSKAYNVILASVTYFKAEIGDQITLVIPEVEDSEWGAIENVIPKGSAEFEDLDI